MPDPPPALPIHEREDRAHFAVRLIPRASRNAFAGVREGVLHESGASSACKRLSVPRTAIGRLQAL